MGPISSVVNFIKCRFMMATITVTLANGENLTGKVVDTFDSVVGLDVGECVIFINGNQIVTFTQNN
ncbi:MAG: hypothetical protein N2645_04780 [Clostridia bacterium]|nr:hypothetical protein [Clostridia bacterium]